MFKVEMCICVEKNKYNGVMLFKDVYLPFAPIPGMMLYGHKVKSVNWERDMFYVALETIKESNLLARKNHMLELGWKES